MKYKKWFLIIVAAVAIFIFVQAYLFWWPAYLLNQKIDELKNEGANVEELVYAEFQAEATTTNPDAVFAKKDTWADFKQQVLATEALNGSVTVWG